MNEQTHLATETLKGIATLYDEYRTHEGMGDNSIVRIGFYMLMKADLLESPLADETVQRLVMRAIRELIDAELSKGLPILANAPR